MDSAEIHSFIAGLSSQRLNRSVIGQSNNFRSYYPSSIISEEQNEPRPPYAPSVGTSETVCLSTFSDDDVRCAYSDSTAPSRNGIPRQRTYLPIPEPVERMTLPCEFIEYGHCDITFDINDESEWIAHIADAHLGDHLPARCVCWFCTEEYTASSNSYDDRWQCYSNRMQHVAGHFRNGWTRSQIQPDRYFTHHIYKIRILTHDEYRLAMSYHEPQQSEHYYHAGWRPEQYGLADVVIETRPRRHDQNPKTRSRRYYQ